MSSEAVLTPKPPPSLGNSQKSARPALSKTVGLGDETIRHSYEVLDVMNESLNATRGRHEAHQNQRVAELTRRDKKRSELIQRQHSANVRGISHRLDHLMEKDGATYRVVSTRRAEHAEHIMELKYKEIERRREFSARRSERLADREATAEHLREAVFLTSKPNHSPRDVSPTSMSKEVADRLLYLPIATSPRKFGEQSQELPHIHTSKEALQRLQAQRDAQVEQKRLEQKKALDDKMQKRHEHLEELRHRLDDIVHSAQEECKRKAKKRREEEQRIAGWRWRKQHALRAEAIERILSSEQQPSQQTSPRKERQYADDQVHSSNKTPTVPKEATEAQHDDVNHIDAEPAGTDETPVDLANLEEL